MRSSWAQWSPSFSSGSQCTTTPHTHVRHVVAAVNRRLQNGQHLPSAEAGGGPSCGRWNRATLTTGPVPQRSQSPGASTTVLGAGSPLTCAAPACENRASRRKWPRCWRTGSSTTGTGNAGPRPAKWDTPAGIGHSGGASPASGSVNRWNSSAGAGGTAEPVGCGASAAGPGCGGQAFDDGGIIGHHHTTRRASAPRLDTSEEFIS